MPQDGEEMIEDSIEEIPIRKSKNRREIERMLERIGACLDSRINVVNLDNGERYFFDNYSEAMEFMKGKKGRWYIAAPGARYNKDGNHR